MRCAYKVSADVADTPMNVAIAVIAILDARFMIYSLKRV